jgi:hypothetical protein
LEVITVIFLPVLCYLYWVGHAEHMGELRNAYKILVGKPDEKRPLRRTMHKWEDNIKMDLKEIECRVD